VVNVQKCAEMLDESESTIAPVFTSAQLVGEQGQQNETFHLSGFHG